MEDKNGIINNKYFNSIVAAKSNNFTALFTENSTSKILFPWWSVRNMPAIKNLVLTDPEKVYMHSPWVVHSHSLIVKKQNTTAQETGSPTSISLKNHPTNPGATVPQ